MRESLQLKVPKWPFFLADVVVLGLAYFIYAQRKGPLSHWEIGAICISVGAGALLGIMPFLLEYRALLKALEITSLDTAVDKIQQLETVAAQISGVTNHWQLAQEQADKTAANAKEIADRMTAEVQEFNQFMAKINDGEKATLRLEVEKLRRAENDWLSVIVHMLDHTFALHRGAERSGQANVIAQVGSFQNACRDVARRLGLVPLLVNLDEPFDAARHQWADGENPPEGAIVSEMVAPGFTFQGKLIRPALVRVHDHGAPAPKPAEAEPAKMAEPDQLLLAPEETA